jgi:PadR family transcriptional regulator, regulatory protein AphA
MSLKHLILALVAQKPSTGYEITYEFDAVSSFFWRASHQQIYRELAALAEGGLLRFKIVDQRSKPDKKVYFITAKGKKAFAAWFAEPEPLPRQTDGLMIKFFSGELGGIDELRNQLKIARAAHEARLKALQAVAAEHYREPVGDMPRWKQCIYLTLQLGLARERTWLEWAEASDKVLAKDAR